MKKQTKPEVFLDHYLNTIGLWRKPVPRDGLSLFRAVSEQLFNTQVFHTNLYEACRIVFLQLGKNPEKDWTENEVISILSRMYKREFYIYETVGQQPVQATDNNYQHTILLCRINENQLDSVYPINFQESLAICQSILYEVLYHEVFGLDQELTDAVNLIRDQNKHKMSLMSNRFDDMQDSCMKKFQDLTLSPKDRQSSRKPIPPVPYRIAKALDPRIYRNVELDIWEEERRDQIKDSPEYKERFSLGDKCQVILEGVHYHGFLQEISASDNTVVVFIHELGEKKSVPIRSLKSPPRHSYNYINPRNRRQQDWLSYDINGKRVPQSDQTENFPGKRTQYTTALYNQQQSTAPLRGEVMSNVNCDYVGMDISPVQNINNNIRNQLPPLDTIQRFPPPTVIHQQQQHHHQQQQQHHQQQHQHQQTEVINTLVSSGCSIVPTSNYSCPQLRVPYFDSVAIKDVNMNCYPSQDVAGQDLPEVNTLRFFYNLGVENFRSANQGTVWTGTEMMSMVPPGVMTHDHINGNFVGQFAIPPPPFIQYTARPEQHIEQYENKMNHCIVPYKKVLNVSPVSKGKSSTESLTTSPSKSQSDLRCDESIDSNDSGCDSDSTNGSAHCNSVKELENDINTANLEKKLDNYIAKADDNDNTNCVSLAPEFQVPNKPKTKKKYYMYGNLKLVKPIKDIPPKFLSKLSSLSSEKSRCEGEPIIIPCLPPKPYRKYNKPPNSVQNEAITTKSGSVPHTQGFNPEAKCFIPGDSVMHDPSIVACGSQSAVQYVPCNMYASTSKPEGSTIYPSYLPTYMSSNNTGTLTHANPNHGNPGTVSNSNLYSTNSGDGFKHSMHPISTGQQPFQMYPATYPVYYPSPAGSYVEGATTYYPPTGMMGQCAYQSQYCSVQPQVNNAMQTS